MNKKVISLFKDGLGGKILTEFVELRAKTYTYLMDDDSDHRNIKRTKKCVITWILMFNDYNNCLSNDKIILKSQ